jgi:hypothetical protein
MSIEAVMVDAHRMKDELLVRTAAGVEVPSTDMRDPEPRGRASGA